MSSSSDVEVSERNESQFERQSGDEETLWEVIQITAERGNKYRVKWAGVDPKTGKPWPQDWVPKKDCTDDLARQWKKTKARKAEAAAKRKATKKDGAAKSRRLGSSVSKTSSTGSTLTKRVTRSSATAAPESTSTIARSDLLKPHISGTANIRDSPAKRKRSPSESSSDSFPSVAELSSPPKKKQKVGIVAQKARKKEVDLSQLSFEIAKPKKYGKVLPTHSETDEEDENEVRSAVLVDSGKRKERSPDIFDEVSDSQEDQDRLSIRPTLTKVGPPRGKKQKGNGSTVSKGSSLEAHSSSSFHVKGQSKKKSKPQKTMKPYSETRDTHSPTEDDDIVGTVVHVNKRDGSGAAGKARSSISRKSGDIKARKKKDEEDKEVKKTKQHSEVRDSDSPTVDDILVEKVVHVNKRSRPGAPGKARGFPSRTSTDLKARTRRREEAQEEEREEGEEQEEEELKEDKENEKEDKIPSNKITAPGVSNSLASRLDDRKTMRMKLAPSGALQSVTISSPLSSILSPAAQSRLAKFDAESFAADDAMNVEDSSPAQQVDNFDFYGDGNSDLGEMDDGNDNDLPIIDHDAAHSSPSIAVLPVAPNSRSPSRSQSANLADLPAPTSQPLVDDSVSIVPETEEQSSTHSHYHDRHSPSPAAEQLPETQTENHLSDEISQPTDPTFSSRVSPVKSHTGHKSKSKSKSLHPVPYVSPSTFRPYISPLSQVIDFPPSSIEEFSSPEKGKGSRGVHKYRKKKAQIIVADGGSNGAIRARGLELATQATRKREQEKLPTKTKRKTLGDIIARPRPVNEGKADDREADQEKGPQIDSTSVRTVPSLAEELDSDWGGIIPIEKDKGKERNIIEEMEAAYVDLNGGSENKAAGLEVEVHETESLKHPIGPQEEEESTQDLLREQEDLQAKAPAPKGNVAISSWFSQPSPDPPIDDQIEDSQDAIVQQPNPRSNSRSVSTHPDETAEGGHPATILQDAPKMQDSMVQTTPQPPDDRLTNALNLVNTNLGEITALRTSLAALLAKNDDLVRLADEAKKSAVSTADTNVELERKLAEAAEQRTEDEASKNLELTTLKVSLETMAKSKADAEGSLEFFREKYQQASGFVTEVQAENRSLEQRTLIAEGQVKDGVGMVRAVFESRVKMLEEELGKWKGLAELLTEKDRRTGDEIRKQAAETPELRALAASLNDELSVLHSTVDQQNQEVKELREEVDRLTWDNVILMREKAIWAGEVEKTQHLSNGMAADDEQVYRCQWMPSGSNMFCADVFSNLQDLSRHVEAHVQNMMQDPNL